MKRFSFNTWLFTIICFWGLSCISINNYAVGYASISQGVSISPTTVTLNTDFYVNFTLKETGGSSITFEKIAIAVLKSDGTYLFDFSTYYTNITIGAYSSWSPSTPAPGQIWYNNGTNPAGTYKVVIRGKVPGGNWFDFSTTGSGVNPKSFNVVQAKGSLTVTISPNEVANAGAQWKLDNGSWQNSGTTLNNINVGSHTVYFSTVDGWSTPSSKSVTITANQTTTTSATYTQNAQTGSLRLTIYPSDAVNAGAQWKLDNGSWQTSGTKLDNISLGSHMVYFNSLNGWTSPNSTSVTIYANQTTSTTATYSQSIQTGSLTVTITPTDAVYAGAQWKIDNGIWQSSGTTLNNISIGSHSVSFNTIAGWTNPSSNSITITANQTATVTGNYVLMNQYGSVKVNLSPTEAVNAGARWKLDNGAWQTSGTTLNNVSIGTHTIVYVSVTGWSSPSNRSILVTNNATSIVNDTYVKVEVNKEISLAVPFKTQSPPGTTHRDANGRTLWDSKSCGPTSLLMVAKYSKGESNPTEQDIKDIIDWLAKNITGYLVNNYNGSSTNISTLKKLAIEYYGFKEVESHASDWNIDNIIDALKNNTPIIVAVRLGMSSTVTNYNGHFMVCRGVSADRNTFYFNDPGRNAANGQNKSFTRLEFENCWKTQNNSCLIIKDKYSGASVADDNVPINVIADYDVETDDLSICWDKPAADQIINSYNIYRNGSFYKSVNGLTTLYNDASIIPNNTYCYSITAVTTFESDFSNSTCYNYTVRTTGIDPILTNKEDLIIYPNPASNTIHFITNLNVTYCTIINSNGMVILHDQVIQNKALDISVLHSGLYFARLNTSKGTITVSFIKY